MVTSEKQNAELLADIVKDCREAARIRRQQNFHPLSARDVAGIYERLADSIERAAAPSRCDRCGSSGDVFVLCSGCHGPIPSPHPRGEPVTQQYRYQCGDEWSEWITLGTKATRLNQSNLQYRYLYAAPPSAGADAVRAATIEECAKIAEVAKMDAVKYHGSEAGIGADVTMRRIRALLPAPQSQEKPTGDQT